jgi:nitrous oxide reductase
METVLNRRNFLEVSAVSGVAALGMSVFAGNAHAAQLTAYVSADLTDEKSLRANIKKGILKC